MKTSVKSRAGFTLIELLLVIGIIAILAAIVIVAINPTKQLGDARDAQRRSDVNTLLNAIWQYAIDNNGAMPCDVSGSPCVDATWRQLGTGTTNCEDDVGQCSGLSPVASACLSLHALSGTYLVDIPVDPRYGTGTSGYAGETGYMVQATNSRVTVRACQPEQTTSIEVTR